jgi:hypothetical protein
VGRWGRYILTTKVSQLREKYPRRDSNAGPWLRRPVLYPLSYGGFGSIVPQSPVFVNRDYSGSMSTISPSTALLRPDVGGGGGGGGACALGGSIIGGSRSACIIVWPRR